MTPADLESGKEAGSWVRRDQEDGVSTSRLRSERVGCWEGTLTVEGPRKIAFSTFARVD